MPCGATVLGRLSFDGGDELIEGREEIDGTLASLPWGAGGVLL
jgi:hypothetical protein